LGTVEKQVEMLGAPNMKTKKTKHTGRGRKGESATFGFACFKEKGNTHMYKTKQNNATSHTPT